MKSTDSAKIGLIVVFALILAALRIGGVKHEAFQAIAHLFEGGLLWAGAIEMQFSWSDGGLMHRINAYVKLGTAVVLGVVELICFAIFFFAK